MIRYGIINPINNKNQMLLTRLFAYGLGFIAITGCITDTVSCRSGCYIDNRTRDSLPWFFFNLFQFYTHTVAGLIDFSSFFGPTL